MATSKKSRNTRGTASTKSVVPAFLDKIAPHDKASAESDWTEVRPDLISELVRCVSVSGGAVMFGRSRSGDSLSLTLFFGEDKRTMWFGEESDLDTEFVKIITAFEAVSG